MRDTTVVYRFDDFQVDPADHRLTRGGRPVPLEPKTYEVLLFLIENRGRLVEKSALLRGVWKDAVVSENAMTRVIARLRRALGDVARAKRYIETAPTLGYRFIADVRLEQVGSASSDPSAGVARRDERIEALAVLPLRNLSGDPTQNYFSEGLTDALITELTRIGSLRVISRTSVMPYLDSRKTLPEIAAELGVDAIVEGSALRAGERVRVSAQLIDARQDRHLWAETYDREISDVLALHGEVARAIAHQVEIKLTRQERARLTKSRPIDPNAFEFYLRGLYCYCHGRDQAPRTAGIELLQKSFDCFQQAIALHPRYGQAHAALAEAYHAMAICGSSQFYAKAKGAALTALAIDDTIPEAHVALANVKLKYDWDWAGAEREYCRAIQLNPNTPSRYWYGMYLWAAERPAEALTQIRLAEQVDPLNLSLKMDMALIYFSLHEHEKGITQLQRTMDLDPNLSMGRWLLGESYALMGLHDQAVAEFQKGLALSQDGDVLNNAGLARTYALAGRRAEALRLLKGMLTDSKGALMSSYLIATVFLALEDAEQAFAWLERAYDEHSDSLTYLKVDPRFFRLRPDPRFQSLVRRISLA